LLTWHTQSPTTVVDTNTLQKYFIVFLSFQQTQIFQKKKILFRDPLFSATSMTFQGPQQNRENGIKKYKKKII